MKILILGSKEYPLGTNKGDDPHPSGGFEVYVENLVKGLSKYKDIEIKVVTRHFIETKKHEKKNNIEIYREKWLPGNYLRNVSFNFFAFLKSLLLDFDIIHSHGIIANFLGLILSKIKKVPIVAAPHGLLFDQPHFNMLIKKVISLLEKLTYKRVDYVVFSSPQEKELFNKKLGFLPSNYNVILSGVDTTRFENIDKEKIRKEFNIKNNKIITFIGRLVKVKGVRYFIEAVNHLTGDFSVLIVGDGPQRKELETMVSQLELNNVIFTGRVPSIPDILVATDIFVLPSLSEGLPLVLLEAMAAGKPCVVTNIGLPVEHMKDALVVKVRDAESLAEAIQKLLADELLSKKLGVNAKKKAKNEFSWENAVEDHLKLFEQIKSGSLS
jgi:glycosyltransferase involved in cell wall biosynthesis